MDHSLFSFLVILSLPSLPILHGLCHCHIKTADMQRMVCVLCCQTPPPIGGVCVTPLKVNRVMKLFLWVETFGVPTTMDWSFLSDRMYKDLDLPNNCLLSKREPPPHNRLALLKLPAL